MPDVWVTSIKMTGAPSTKPPAVIGRERASFTGACALPVLMPLCWLGAPCFSVGLCCAGTRLRIKARQNVCITAARETRLGWRDREDSIRPQVSLVYPGSIFAQRWQAGLTYGEEDSASGEPLPS